MTISDQIKDESHTDQISQLLTVSLARNSLVAVSTYRYGRVYRHSDRPPTGMTPRYVRERWTSGGAPLRNEYFLFAFSGSRVTGALSLAPSSLAILDIVGRYDHGERTVDNPADVLHRVVE